MKSSAHLLSLVALCSLAQEQAPKPVAQPDLSAYEARTIAGPDATTLPYRLLIPKNYDKAVKYPLVLFLHGAGERGNDNQSQLKHGAPLFVQPQVREKFPCFVMAPQCPEEQTWSPVKGWTGPNAYEEQPTAPMKIVLGAVDALIKEFSIDTNRLYVTGLSMGGYGSWDAITRAPDRWAAAAPVCGGGDASRIAVAKAVPVWAFHGLLDPTVPPVRSREMIDALRMAGGHPMLSEYPYTSHNSWTNAYSEPELLPWLFAQRRGQPAVAFAKVAGDLAMPPSSEFIGEGTVQAGAWFRDLWKNRRTEWSKSKDADQGAVVFFGDSITQGWNTLAADFANMKTANRGISGDTTRGLRGRLQGDVLDVHPSAVSMLIGTNDLDQGTEPEVIVTNVKAIVAELHKASPSMPIVINKVMPRGAKAKFFPDKIRQLNGLYEAAFKDDPKVTFCDTWTLFDAGDGQCKRDEFPDMLHPNTAGYAKWTAALQPIFAKLGLSK